MPQVAIFILSLDHRATFRRILGIRDRELTEAERQEIQSLKQLVFDGYRASWFRGVARHNSGVLADEDMASGILVSAREKGCITALAVEREGHEFAFEYGTEFRERIRKFMPRFVKARVTYDPDGDKALNQRQKDKLLKLSEFCALGPSELFLQIKVPSPKLAPRAMKELQDAGVAPRLWGVSGTDRLEDLKVLVAQARCEGRAETKVMLMSPEESLAKAKCLIRDAANLEGMAGFAIGRSIFLEPLQSFQNGTITYGEAVELISRYYSELIKLWSSSSSEAKVS